MERANWAKDHLCDVHFQANGATGGWTVKTWVGFINAFIKTEHRDSQPPSMDQVIDAVLEEIK